MQNQNYLTNKYRDTIQNIVTRCDQVDENYSTFDGKNIKSLRKDILSEEYIKDILFDDNIQYLERIHVLLQAVNKKKDVCITKYSDSDVLITILDKVFDEFIKKISIRIGSLKFFKNLGHFFHGKDVVGALYKNENRSLSFTDLLDDELEHFYDQIYFIPSDYIYDALTVNKSLEKLYLGRIGDDCTIGLCKAMELNTNIKHLRFEIFGEDEFYNTTNVIDSLIKMFNRNKTLKRIDLIGDYDDLFIKNPKLPELFSAMNNGVLEHIQLNCFNHKNVLKTQMNFSDALEKLLEKNSSLEVLNLCHCEMNGIMCGFFSRVLPKNNKLVKLMLPINKIGNMGLMSIMNGLTINTTLRELDVSYNQHITNEYVQKVKEQVRKDVLEVIF